MDFLKAWLVMLLLGAAHSGDGRVPALGYWVTLCLVVAVSLTTHQAQRDK